MSDNDQTVAPTGKVIAEGDHKFILCMLSHVTGGSIAVDINAVAIELGYGNPKSAANKMTKVKKDYGIPFITGKPSATGVVSSSGDGDKPTPVKTPGGRTKLPSAKPPPKTKVEKKIPSKRGPPSPEDDEDEATEVEEQPTPKKVKKSPAKKEPKVKAPAKPKVPKTPTKTPAKAKATPKVKKSAVKVASEEDDADVSGGDASTKEDVTTQDNESVSEEFKSKSESQVDASQAEEVEDDDA